MNLPTTAAHEAAREIAELRARLAQAEQTIAQLQSGATEERLRLLSTAVESAANGVVITDREGRILWSNPAFTRLTGYTQAEAMGQPARLLKSGSHPPAFYRQMWETILCGEPWQGEMVNRRKDGSLFCEEITITPVRAGNDQITHFVAIKQDVTARKRAEQRLELLATTAGHLLKSESPQRIVDELCRRLMTFLDCQVFFNFLVDEAAGKLHLNACAGISEAEARQLEWLDYGVAFCGCAARDCGRIVAEELQHSADPRAALVKSFGVQAYACHPLVVQGRLLGTLSFGTRTRSRFTEDELAVMQAVTDQVAIAMERRRTQEALQRANGELEQRVVERTAALEAMVADLKSLSFTLVHDLRAPLRAMGMFCQLLDEEYQDSPRPLAQEYTRRIVTSARRMDRLIQDVLQYSRLAESELGVEKVDLGPLLRGIIESYPNLHAPGVSIVLEEPLPWVFGNTAALTQCFSNLLGNAVKFVAPGVQPQVRVWAEPLPQATSPAGQANARLVRIWVEDNGIGIPQRAHERIFKLFQRLNTAYEGDGVGLPIVRKAVERMGGAVGVESEPGQGSRFWLELKPA